MPVIIGTSGWQYRHWRRGSFYPRGLSSACELSYYAERFSAVESNSTFYRLPERQTFERWASEVSDDFLFAVKVSRFLTHIKRLKDPEEPVKRLMERIEPLGPKLGPLLLQLPPQMKCDPARLDGALRAFGRDVRVAVEFRHDSWFVDEVREVLAAHGAALCLADRGADLVSPEWKTADWAYIRFHSGTASPPSCYDEASLRPRAELLARLWGRNRDVFVFFNNDGHACALRDAARFASLVREAGMRPTRVASEEDVRVG